MRFFNWLKKEKPTDEQGMDPNIIVAEVLEWAKHPNADRLRVVKLNVGDRIVEPVVCGASNFDIGDKVAFALPGARILKNHHDTNGGPFVLEKATIRGIESQGMICSSFELGLSEEPGTGIMILKSDVRPGDLFDAKMVAQK